MTCTSDAANVKFQDSARSLKDPQVRPLMLSIFCWLVACFLFGCKLLKNLALDENNIHFVIIAA